MDFLQENKIKSPSLVTLFYFLLIIFCFLLPVSAFAQNSDELIVIFKPEPLFSQINFAPGQSASGIVEVKNKSGQNKPIAVEAINVNDPDNFANALNLDIQQNEINLFEASLADFFSAGEIFLSNLSSQASTSYKFIISFIPSAADEEQGKILNNFDILIGFKGEAGGQSGAGGSSSAGGSGLTHGLTIFNEAEIDITDTGAIITWQTNYFSTSRVVYSSEGQAHTFNLSSQPNYGYMHSSAEKDSPADIDGVIYHQVDLTGLAPFTTYYYRCISHASPDTVSREYSFTTQELKNLPKANQSETDTKIPADLTSRPFYADSSEARQEQSRKTAEIIVPGIGFQEPGRVAGEQFGQEGIVLPQQKNLTAHEKDSAGRVQGASICQPPPWWIFVLILILYVFTLLFYRRQWRKKHFRHWIYFPIGLSFFVILLVWALAKCWI